MNQSEMDQIVNKIVDHEVAQMADNITDCICNLVRTFCFDDKVLYRNILDIVEHKLGVNDAE